MSYICISYYTAVRQCSRCCTSMYLQIKTCGQSFKIHDRPLLYIRQISGWATAWKFSTVAAITAGIGNMFHRDTHLGRRTFGMGRIGYYYSKLYTFVLLLECPSLACSSSGLHSMSSCGRHTQIWQQLAEPSPDVGHLSVCVVTKRRLRTPWMVERASHMLFCAR